MTVIVIRTPILMDLRADSAIIPAGVMPPAMTSTYPDKVVLTLLMMEAGVGLITLHSIPHAATMNRSDQSRVNVYSRIRRFRAQNPHEGNPVILWGISDHPDRAMNGDWLEYPVDYDPYACSREKLCDHWSDWQGMQDLVEAHASTTTDCAVVRTASRTTDCASHED